MHRLLLLLCRLPINHPLPSIRRLIPLIHRRDASSFLNLLVLLNQCATATAAREQAVVAGCAVDTGFAADLAALGDLEEELGRIEALEGSEEEALWFRIGESISGENWWKGEGAWVCRRTHGTVDRAGVGLAFFQGFGFAVEDAGAPECDTA